MDSYHNFPERHTQVPWGRDMVCMAHRVSSKPILSRCSVNICKVSTKCTSLCVSSGVSCSWPCGSYVCITDDDGEHSAVFPFKVYPWALDSTQTVEIISTRLTEMSTNSKILLYQFTRNAMGLDGEETNAARWKWKLSPVFPETCYGCGTGGISSAHIPSGKTPRIPVSQNTYWLSKETAFLKTYMYVSLCISHITLYICVYVCTSTIYIHRIRYLFVKNKNTYSLLCVKISRTCMEKNRYIRAQYDSARISALNYLSNEPIILLKLNSFVKGPAFSCQASTKPGFLWSSGFWDSGKETARDSTRNQLLFPLTARCWLPRGLSLPANPTGLALPCLWSHKLSC